MKLRLRSDFRDFYDSAFDNAYGTVFERLTRNSMDRWAMMQTLEELGYRTPKWGTAKNIINLADKETQWVVHYDPLAHRGESKVVLCGPDVLKYGPDCFVTQYEPVGRGTTTRLLVIGDRRFRMRYRSRDDWRSNCGDVTIDELYEGTGVRPTKYGPFPLYAIDFLVNNLAIDLNTSPGMTGTGIENLITAKEVVGEIKGWFEWQSKQA